MTINICSPEVLVLEKGLKIPGPKFWDWEWKEKNYLKCGTSNFEPLPATISHDVTFQILHIPNLEDV